MLPGCIRQQAMRLKTRRNRGEAGEEKERHMGREIKNLGRSRKKTRHVKTREDARRRVT